MTALYRCSIATATAVVAFSLVLSASASAPSNLCTLNLKKQLNILGVGHVCKQAKTAHVGPLTIEGANWGTTNDSIGVQIYTGVPHARFAQQFAQLGSPVALGTGGHEAAGATGVIVSGWVDGAGLVVNFNHPAGPEANAAYRTRMLALAQAIAKHV